jgi:glycosyltransferase involved in cell wall biosynthesis
MKILHLDFDDLKSPLGGGQARITFEISRRLAKRHDVTVITSKYPGSKDEVIEKIKYIRIGLKNFPWNFGAYIWLAPEIVRQYEHDILIESFVPPISTMFTPFFTKKPVVGMAHWFFAREMSQKYKLPFVLWERLGIKFYKNFIVYNNDWAIKFKEMVPDANILINTYPVDGPQKKPEFSEKDYILFLGRIDIHHKGLDLLLKAYDKIANQISTKLIIAGGGREEAKLKRMIGETRHYRKINFIGRYDSQKRGELLKDCKLVVLPSRYEMAPLVAKEVMSYAKPLIIFDIIGTREVLSRECAIYIKPYNVNLYGQAILDLLNDPRERKQMGQMGRKRFEDHIDWDESALRQEKFCRDILQ